MVETATTKAPHNEGGLYKSLFPQDDRKSEVIFHILFSLQKRNFSQRLKSNKRQKRVLKVLHKVKNFCEMLFFSSVSKKLDFS